jgi:hypothetical protein
MDLGWASISPSVDFTNVFTAFLADSPGSWPERFIISGLSYDRFQRPQGTGGEQLWDEDARCRWLSRQTAFDPGPYEQAARVYRQHGYINKAERILIAQRRQARRGLRGGTLARRIPDIVYSVTVGYGYRPVRVLWLLAILLVMVTASLELPAARATMRATTSAGIVYNTRGPLPTLNQATTTDHAGQQADSCGNGQVRCFSPALYAIDTVIPLISLDQRSTWYPDSNIRYGALMQWWLNISTMLGWLLSSIFALSFTRFARST